MSDEPGIPIKLDCPVCHKPHVDVGVFKTKPHKSHACQYCGQVWTPALVNTVGVKFLPGCLDVDRCYGCGKLDCNGRCAVSY